MTARAYQTGMAFPSLTPGQLRVYSLRFCPFAQRVLLILAAKNIDHEVININLKKRPEWSTKVLPAGTVPVLHQDNMVISGSMAIAEYLEEVYTSPRLLPSDPYRKALDRSFLDLSLPALDSVLKFYFKKGVDADSDWSAFLAKASIFEKELGIRKTPYFSGEKPGFVDFVNWPTFSMALGVSAFFEAQRMPSQEEYPLLYRWCEIMRQDPVVTSVINESNTLEFIRTALLGDANFDAGL
uniref:Glutathione-dependent dehydroascorbate reductase n=1 Tax=Ixodes ricinus TaxID=34613 RepID=A0A131Y9X5_IXORI